MSMNNGKPRWSFYIIWITLTSVCIPIAYFFNLIVLKIIAQFVGDFINVNGVRHITASVTAECQAVALGGTMADIQGITIFESRSVIRNLLFVFFATILFLLKGQYSGPFQELVYSYGGNVTISFALYFVFLKLCMMLPRFGRLVAAAVVLACVESFEVFNGFGFMANTYDPFDLLANAIGVAIALGVDTTPPPVSQQSRGSPPTGQGSDG